MLPSFPDFKPKPNRRSSHYFNSRIMLLHHCTYMNVDYALNVLNMTTSAGNQVAFGKKCDDFNLFFMVILFWVQRKYVICNSWNFNITQGKRSKIWIRTLTQSNLNRIIQFFSILNNNVSFRHRCNTDNWLNSEILFTGGFPRPRLRRWGEDGPVQSHICCHAVWQHEIQTETQGRTGWSRWNCWCREGKSW